MQNSAQKFIFFLCAILILSAGVYAAGSSDITLDTYVQLRVFESEKLIPIVVENYAPYEQSYYFSVDNSVARWGTYRFEPSSQVTLAPGEKTQMYLLLRADNNDAIGLQRFNLMVQSSNGDARTVKMSANVLKAVEKKSIMPLIIAFFIIALIGIVIIAAAVFMIKRATRPRNDEFNDYHDIDSFLDDEPQQESQSAEEFNEFDDFDDFDIFDDAESDKVIDNKKGEEFY